MAHIQRFISQLPKVSKASLDDEDKYCSICKEEFESNILESSPDEGVRLPCNHLFGSRCITTWAVSQNSCPTCRRPILPEFFLYDELSPNDQQLADEIYDYLESLLYRSAAETGLLKPEMPTDGEIPLVAQPWFDVRGFYRTMLLRERLLFQDLQASGVPLPALRRPDQINACHVEALFASLLVSRVFERSWQGFKAMENSREMFNILRGAGFVWNLERATWVSFMMGRTGWRYIRVE